MSATSTPPPPSAPPAVRPEHFASAVVHPLVAALRTRDCESGYRGVYRLGPGRDRWAAKVRVNDRLTWIRGSASHLPHQAALHLACWYFERYGPGWARRAAERVVGGTKPWRVWRVRAVRTGPERRRGGFAARVWEFGLPVEVTGRRRPRAGADGAEEPYDRVGNCRLRARWWKKPGRLLVFASRSEARAAVRAWVRDRWGLFAEAVVWRR